jgi:predicted amidohydrolase
MTKNPKLALIQDSPVFLNLAETLKKTAKLAKQAASDGANIIAFPETWLVGYPVWLDEAQGSALWDDKGAKALYRLLVENSLTLGDETCDFLQNLANETGTELVVGANEVKGRSLYNTMLFFSPNADAPVIHRKLTPTYTEKLIWAVGDGSTMESVETEWGVLSGLICWEHWMPFARAYKHQQNEVIHIAQWPDVNERHMIGSRHYAIEGRCFVGASGMVMSKQDVLDGFDSLGVDEPEARALLESIKAGEDGLLKNGNSAIIGPDGAFITEPNLANKTIVMAELPLDELTEQQLTLDTAGHYSRPDVFTLEVDTRERSNIVKK